MQSEDLPVQPDEITEDGQIVEHKTAPSLKATLKALADAVTNGQITAQQARAFRADLGISQSTFTKKQTTPAKRKAKRIAQKLSRRKNRGTGKGQKNSGGRRYG